MPTVANIFGFDPTAFTNAPLQTDGWMRFTDPPEKVFAVLANHEGMTEWLPLLQKVTVTHPRELPPGESTIGSIRELTFPGGITVVEKVVFWNAPLCYAYDSHAKIFPFQNYIGFMGVEPAENGGGTFIFHEYFDLIRANRTSRASAWRSAPDAPGAPQAEPNGWGNRVRCQACQSGGVRIHGYARRRCKRIK